MPFVPKLDTLPAPQRAVWQELAAPRLGHRASVDFDFFSNEFFDPERLAEQTPYLKDAERIQLGPDTLTCRVDRGGPVLISFFGGLGLGQVAASEQAAGTLLQVASLLDLAGTQAAVIQKRAEVKDYLDIAAILRNGIDLATILAAGSIIYGGNFNPLITLKALSYFDDVPALPAEVRTRLVHAAESVDVTRLPLLTPYAKRPGENEITP